jgi:hypothetical protein
MNPQLPPDFNHSATETCSSTPDQREDDKHPLLHQEESTDSENLEFAEKYKITVDELVTLVQEGENRKFSEDIDKLEAYGGFFDFFFIFI